MITAVTILKSSRSCASANAISSIPPPLAFLASTCFAAAGFTTEGSAEQCDQFSASVCFKCCSCALSCLLRGSSVKTKSP